MKKKVRIDITVKGFVNLGTEHKCNQLIEVLLKNDLTPLRFDKSERPKHLFEQDAFIKFWTDMERKNGFGIPFIKGEDYYISISWGGAKPYYTFLIINIEKLNDYASIVNLAKDLYKWNESCYGYVTLNIESSKLATPGYNIMDCLGGITWANFFSKPYVEMWGEEKLLKAPTWKTERLDDGGFLLITTESPLTDRLIADEAESQLRAYLGEEYFFKRPNGSETITRAELYEKVFIGNETDSTGYVAPDFSKYYEI